MFWLMTALVLLLPMPLTPTVAMFTRVARRLEAAPEHVPRHDDEPCAGRRRPGHEIAPRYALLIRRPAELCLVPSW